MHHSFHGNLRTYRWYEESIAGKEPVDARAHTPEQEVVKVNLANQLFSAILA
jgi:hypothetical protein